jgi:hypothetical protein
MIGFIIKAILGLFIWFMLPQIICKQGKCKKSTKTFVSITCQIIGITVVIFACIDSVKFLLNYL